MDGSCVLGSMASEGYHPPVPDSYTGSGVVQSAARVHWVAVVPLHSTKVSRLTERSTTAMP